MFALKFGTEKITLFFFFSVLLFCDEKFLYEKKNFVDIFLSTQWLLTKFTPLIHFVNSIPFSISLPIFFLTLYSYRFYVHFFLLYCIYSRSSHRILKKYGKKCSWRKKKNYTLKLLTAFWVEWRIEQLKKKKKKIVARDSQRNCMTNKRQE